MALDSCVRLDWTFRVVSRRDQGTRGRPTPRRAKVHSGRVAIMYIVMHYVKAQERRLDNGRGAQFLRNLRLPGSPPLV